MNPDEALYFRNRQEWREWLSKNGNSAQEVWLIHYKKQSGKASFNLNEAVEEALCFGWIDGKLKSIDKDRFILRYSPRKADSVWSKINKERAEILIAEGRMTKAGLETIEKAKKNGAWNAAYTSKARDEIPADLEQALKKDADAKRNFHNFAITYQNMYIGWVIGAKKPETRQKRIIEVVKRSAANKKAGIE